MKTMKTGFSIVVLLLSVSVLFVNATFASEVLDETFGEEKSGIVIGSMSEANDRAYDLVVQGENGKMVLVGSASKGLSANEYDVALSRYTADGMLDESFGDKNGSYAHDIDGIDNIGRDAEVQPDGKILVAGYSETEIDTGEETTRTESNVILLRFEEDGYPDETFNTTSAETMEELFADVDQGKAFAVALQEDGKIVVAGYITSEEEGQRIAVVRLDDLGMADEGFGENGLLVLEKDEEFTYGSTAYCMALSEDETILVAGTIIDGEKNDAAVFRFTAEGELDESFGDNGYRTFEGNDVNSVANAIVIQSDNKIVIAGGTEQGPDERMFVARLDASGLEDSTFGAEGDGIVYHDTGYGTVAYGLAIGEDGSIFTTGYGDKGAQKGVLLSHYTASGELIEVTSEATAEESSETGEVSSVPPEGISISPLKVEEGASESIENIEDTLYSTERGEPVLIPVGLGAVGRALLVQEDNKVVTVGTTFTGLYDDMVLLRFAKSKEGQVLIGTEFYNIGTISVTNVGRNSAVSGGKITLKRQDDETTPVVVARGVVYGVVPHPVYRPTSSDSGSSSTTTTTTTNTTTSPTTNSDSSSNTDRIIPETPSFNYEVVRSGQTSDGSGVGVFGSDIYGITPDTWYYVRAYAVLDDDEGTVIYGNEFSFLTEDACFIATAAYGSILEEQVQVLRDFRDVYLLSNAVGQKFVGLYYRWSPPMAEVIAGNETLRGITRALLVPIIWVSKFMLNTNVYTKLLVVGALLSLMTLMTRRRIRLAEMK